MIIEICVFYIWFLVIDCLFCDFVFFFLLVQYGYLQVVMQLCQMLDEVWEQICQCQILFDWSYDWLYVCEQWFIVGQWSVLCLVFNFIGMVLYINLGCVIQVELVVEVVVSVMCVLVMFEYDFDDVGCGYCDCVIVDLLCQIIGVEDVCIVNNNVVVVLLMLVVIVSGCEVVVFCGELVEIGGVFCIFDVMCQVGCQLYEVGIINCIYVKDYCQVVNDNIVLLMKVYISNYSIEGFIKVVDEVELVVIGCELDVLVVVDLGSGLLVDFSQYGLLKELMLQEMIVVGVSLVSFFGDKLFGGLQVGIIVGKCVLIVQL